MNSLSFTVSDGVATLAIQRAAVSNAIDITHHPRACIWRSIKSKKAKRRKGGGDHRQQRCLLQRLGFAFGRSENPRGAAAGAFRNAPLHGPADPALERLPLSHRCGRQWRGGRRRHESRARERHHHRRRQCVLSAVVRALGSGAGCGDHFSPGAPHRRRPLLVVVDACGAHRRQDRARLGSRLCGGARRGGGAARASRGASACQRTMRGARPDSLPCTPRPSTIRCRSSCAPSAARRR